MHLPVDTLFPDGFDNQLQPVHIYSDKDNGGKGIKDATLNLDIYGNDNTYIASNPNRIIEFGFDDVINFDANGNQIIA